jgi:hypothetical protein
MIIFLLLFVFKDHHFLLGWKVKISVWGSSLNFKETTSYGPLSISESKDHWFQFFGKKAGEKKNPTGSRSFRNLKEWTVFLKKLAKDERFVWSVL